MNNPRIQLALDITEKARKLLDCLDTKSMAFNPEFVEVNDSYFGLLTEAVRLKLGNGSTLLISITTKGDNIL